jgi:pSer/pThr/pTyr-binding forkhead associated (FHA) protein
MAGPTIISPSATAEGITERFDPIECLDESLRHRAITSEPLEAGRYLEVQGHDRTLTIPLEEDVIRIGRGLAADVRLDENSVSRRHAIIDVSGGTTRLLDDRSSNGTFVNGMAVQQAELRSGDVIAIGRVQLRYLVV